MDLLRHLDFFVAVADEGHFGRAAGRLGIAQPPLSQGIQRLERDLGAVLLLRNSRGVRLTPAGADLLPRARDLLAAAAALREAARGHGAGGLRLGVVPLVGPATAAALTAAAGDAAGPVDLATAPTTRLVDALADGRLDLAVVQHPAVLAALGAGPVVTLPTTVLAPAAHPVPDRPGLRAFAGLPVALPPREHAPAAHDLAVDTCEAAGLPVRAVTAPDDRAALALVAAGRAVAFTADPALAAPRVVRIAVPGAPPLRLRVAWREPPGPDLLDALHAVLHDAAGGAA